MTDTVEKLIAIARDTKWRIVGSIEWYLQEKKERKKEKKKTQIDNHKNLLKKEEEEDNHK